MDLKEYIDRHSLLLGKEQDCRDDLTVKVLAVQAWGLEFGSQVKAGWTRALAWKQIEKRVNNVKMRDWQDSSVDKGASAKPGDLS